MCHDYDDDEKTHTSIHGRSLSVFAYEAGPISFNLMISKLIKQIEIKEWKNTELVNRAEMHFEVTCE